MTFQRAENRHQLQELEGAEGSSLLPHTLGVWMSFLTPFRSAGPAWRGQTRPAAAAKRCTAAGWNRQEFSPLCLHLCREHEKTELCTEPKRVWAEIWVCFVSFECWADKRVTWVFNLRLLVPPSGFNPADAGNTQVSYGEGELINGVLDQLGRGKTLKVELSSQLCCRQMAAQWCWLGRCYLHGDNMTMSSVRSEMAGNEPPSVWPFWSDAAAFFFIYIHH